jgi:hypothetical protein
VFSYQAFCSQRAWLVLLFAVLLARLSAATGTAAQLQETDSATASADTAERCINERQNSCKWEHRSATRYGGDFLQSNQWVKKPTTAAELTKFDKTVAFFKKTDYRSIRQQHLQVLRIVQARG